MRCPRATYQQRQGFRILAMARARWDHIEMLRRTARRHWRKVRVAFWSGVMVNLFLRALTSVRRRITWGL